MKALSDVNSASPEQLQHTAQDNRCGSGPTFFGALRGIWLFTWKSQLTWRRLGVGVIALLALPALIYLTTSSPEAWARNHRLQMGNPETFLAGFAKRANRAKVPLQPNQKTELRQVINDEFARAETASARDTGTEPDWEHQRELSDACFQAIEQRASAVLDENQLAQFRSFQEHYRNQHNPKPPETGWGRTAPFYHSLIELYFFLILPLNCVRLCGALIRDELEADTLSFLTTRPLSRSRLLFAKFLSQAVSLQIWMAAQTVLVFMVGRFCQVPELAALLPVFLGAQVLAVFAWSAFGLLLGQISRRYMALALVYGVIVEMGIGRIPTNINSLSLMHHLTTILSRSAALQSTYHWPMAILSTPLLALLLATGVFVGGAMILFTFREHHRTNEMQK